MPVKDWAPGVIAHKSRIVSENIRFKPEVRGYLANIENRFSAYSRIMGMHLRRTDHIAEHPTAATERYLDLAKAHSDRYDAFFVATDDHATLESIIAALGHDRVLYLDVIRSSDGNPVHKNLAQPNRFQLGLEALADCYALSLCQKAILTQSNLSYAAVLFNPGLEYIVL